MKGYDMKIFLCVMLASAVAGCGMVGKKNDSSTLMDESTSSPTPSPELADVVFIKNGKELGRLVIEDIDDGLNGSFSSKDIGLGSYLLIFEDFCKAPPKLKNELAKRSQKIDFGAFSAKAKKVSANFFKPGFSISERFSTIKEKSVSLNRKNKKGIVTRIACAKIITR